MCLHRHTHGATDDDGLCCCWVTKEYNKKKEDVFPAHIIFDEIDGEVSLKNRTKNTINDWLLDGVRVAKKTHSWSTARPNPSEESMYPLEKSMIDGIVAGVAFPKRDAQRDWQISMGDTKRSRRRPRSTHTRKTGRLLEFDTRKKGWDERFCSKPAGRRINTITRKYRYWYGQQIILFDRCSSSQHPLLLFAIVNSRRRYVVLIRNNNGRPLGRTSAAAGRFRKWKSGSQNHATKHSRKATPRTVEIWQQEHSCLRQERSSTVLHAWRNAVRRMVFHDVCRANYFVVFPSISIET